MPVLSAEQADAMERKIEEAVDKVINEEIKAVLEPVRKELNDVIRDIARKKMVAKKDVLEARIEAWFEANVDRATVVYAQQMLDMALSELKARVLGRK